jgi:cysteine synthase A
MAGRYSSILETIGNTPVVRVNRLAPPGVNLYVKVEAFNPLGSVKDRLAIDIPADMTEEALAISRSTPSAPLKT